MASRVEGQLAMDERILEDPELESALEARLRASDDLSEVRKVYADKDEVARGLIAKLDLSPDDAIRVGRFRVTKSDIPARAVTFNTEATERIRISLAD